MKIHEENGEKFLIIGATRLTFRPAIYDVITDVKKLTPEDLVAIVQDAGLEVPPGVDEKNVLYMAMSFVQNVWYEATAANGQIPQGILDGHAARLKTFEKAVAKARQNPPTVTTPKAPKVPKAPRPGVKPTSPTSRVASRLYAVNPTGDAAVSAGFIGFRKAIHETLVIAGPDARLTFEQVLEQTKARGVVFKGVDGGKNQTAYQLKELVSFGLARLLPVQTEIPADGGPTFPEPPAVVNVAETANES